MKNILNLLTKKDKSEENTYPTVDLNELKLNIIHGNESEIDKAKKELKELKAELATYPSAYCERHNHITVTIDYRKIGDTNTHSFAGYGSVYRLVTKCTTCGKEFVDDGVVYGIPHIVYYKRKLPDSIYDDNSLKENGKTYRMVQVEISRIEDYIKLRQDYSKKVCSLAGHTMEKIKGGDFRCTCCGETMNPWYYYDYYLKNNSITLTGETFLALPVLPRFEELQSELEKEEKKAQEELDSSPAMTKKINANNRR